MINYKQSYFYKILQLIYGELFNLNNSFPQKFMRIACRTPFKNKLYQFIKIFNKNSEIITNQYNIFSNNINADSIYNDLTDNGICYKIKIKDEIIEKIKSFSSRVNYKINRSEEYLNLQEIKTRDDIYIARLINPHKILDEINKIALNEIIIASVRKYLDCNPIFLSSQIWWSFPHYNDKGMLSNPKNNEFGFHYDVDDFKFLKLFVYLSDVTSNHGPHIYIKNNGNKKISEYLDRRLSDAEAKKKYGNSIIELTGKSGDCFIEDTSFYHKGTNPVNKEGRCILQLIYVSKKW